MGGGDAQPAQQMNSTSTVYNSETEKPISHCPRSPKSLPLYSPLSRSVKQFRLEIISPYLPRLALGGGNNLLATHLTEGWVTNCDRNKKCQSEGRDCWGESGETAGERGELRCATPTEQSAAPKTQQGFASRERNMKYCAKGATACLALYAKPIKPYNAQTALGKGTLGKEIHGGLPRTWFLCRGPSSSSKVLFMIPHRPFTVLWRTFRPEPPVGTRRG